MKINSLALRSLWRGPAALAALLALVASGPLRAQEAAETAASEADRVWAETERALTPPVPPAEWRERRPSREEIEQFREQQGKLAAVAAGRARNFYEQYPDHPQATQAREKELEMVRIAVQLGNTNATARLEALEQAKLKDPDLPEEDRFELRAAAVQRAALAGGTGDRDAMMAAFEAGARELMKEFPGRDEPSEMLLGLAQVADAEKARALAREVAEGGGSDKVKASAQALLKKFDALGKPLDIRFTAVDGREVDLARLKGKVVLVDFWATWCGPCVAELPKVKAAYERLHPQGFEIVGISFDKDRERLESFVEKQDMTWPQYFDGKGWENDLGRQYGITSIPAMWLVDKQGNLVDMSARDRLEDKVQKLLAP
ncbi:MAG: TlpA family protein disulfide reductase [Verrucomicrobia bacterium]|jgi:thiol-disulfide isomerase/thioredoxin|nr:TlpA family protein disulfide reductase [Verrucomicrobiota bacterium]